MNLPNKLTVLRVILVPFFVFFLMADFIPHNLLFALLIFIIASYTDFLDGKIARRDNLVTTFGKFMDPLADKILVVSALICFVALGHSDVWMVILIIFREFGVTSVRLLAASDGKVVAANMLGKIKTVTQIIAIIVIIVLQYSLQLFDIFKLPVPELNFTFFVIGEIFLGIATFFSVYSGLVYVKENINSINQMK